MKLSSKQQLFLFRVLQETISHFITDEISITYKKRVKVLNDIMCQQGDTPIEETEQLTITYCPFCGKKLSPLTHKQNMM
jgi:hypothetical protein